MREETRYATRSVVVVVVLAARPEQLSWRSLSKGPPDSYRGGETEPRAPETIGHSASLPRYATTVAAMTIGFRIGAASMNVTAADGDNPLDASRRATGTEPHSHTGNAIPAIPAVGSCKGTGEPRDLVERSLRNEDLDRCRHDRTE
jgi:hypothetical protein